MKYEMHFAVIVLMLCCVTLGFVVSIWWDDHKENQKSIIFESGDAYDLNDCKNLSLESTAYCVRSKVLQIYNYTVRNDTIKPYDDIVANGGDCFDYSHLYLRMVRTLGFNGTIRTIPSHAYADFYNDEGYCVMDLTSKPRCILLGVSYA